MTIDIMLKITTPITCKEGRKTIGGGTGFFFRHNNQLYLITNRHIFVDEQKNFFPDRITIRLNKAGNDLTQSGKLTYELYKSKSDEKMWIEISPQIDLAALEIEDPKGFILAALGEQNLPSKDLLLSLGEQVLVIGYPKGFYDDVHNLPITRNATVASAYGVPFKKNPLFLIDSRLHPGTSGSPVITVPKNVTQNPTGGVSVSSTPQWYFLGVNGGEFGDLQLNATWYSILILELLKNDRSN